MVSFSSIRISKQQLISILFIIIITSIFSHVSGRECHYKSIISVGDSLADTGNLVNLSPPNMKPASAFPPYGETYFGRPKGRYCDGRLVIDFFAQKFGLPLVPPYFGGGNGSEQKFLKGVNFAVSGATALDNTSLAQKGIPSPITNVSLGVQVALFKKLLPSLCSSSSECNEFLGNSLILMGEIGGNDFNFAFFQGISNETIRELVPHVISVISKAIQELIKVGGFTFLVPGNLPIGCLPIYLTLFQTSNKQDYDRSGCLIWLNQFSEYYNGMLKKEVNKLRSLHPGANIVYADYYRAAIILYRSPGQFGFKNTVIACCGGGGPYNYNVSLACGSPGSNLCEDPSSYISWDGIHLTEATYRLISKALLDGSSTIPPFIFPCA